MKDYYFQIVLYCIFVGLLKADLQCPAEGKWIIKSFNGPPFCYTTIELESEANALKDDICKRNAHPLSHVASIHSKAENDFLMKNFYGAMIGFYIPSNVKWSSNNFRWSDGSTVDFVGWDKTGIPKQPDNQIPKERFVKLRKKFKSSGWHDYQFKEMKKVLCKMNAFESAATIPPSSTATLLTSSQPSAATTTTNKESEATINTSVKTSDTVSSSTSTVPTTTTPSTTTTVLPSTQSTTTTTTVTATTTISSTTPSTTSSVTSATTTTSVDDGGIVILDGAKP